jgi:CRP-like cAMP-binding protein
VSVTSLAVALQVSGVVTAALVLASVPALLALAAATDERRRRDRAMTRLLGRTKELAPLEPVDLERLARAAVERIVAAGTTVIRAGDVADDVYVVRSGTARVTVDGVDATEVPDLGPGDLFGEIGLVRGIARTATVTASTELQLAVIDGATFLATVVPPGGGPLAGGMFHRLGGTYGTS